MSDSLMPLAMARPGAVATLVAVNAGLGLRRRLADMGLSSGASFRVVHSQLPGPIIIELRGSRLALGRGMAQKIMVKAV